MNPNPLPGATLTRGPADWQILQQGPDGFADIPLAGVYLTTATRFRVEVRAVFEADGTVPPGAPDWTAANLGDGNTWTLTLRLPAGGLYRIETRVWRTDCPDIRPMRGDYVHHVGVGDVWVIAGQSNASGTGTGPAMDPPELGLHQLGNDEVWKLATHPLEDATRSRHPATVHGVFQAHAPWLTFARRLKASLGYPIALIPTALGGSAIAMWQPGAKLFENLAELVTVAGGKVKGIVWHQGESDCNPERVAVYGEQFRTMVKGLRARLHQPDLPVITGQLATYTEVADDEGHRIRSQMRETQRQLARELGHDVVPLVDLGLGDEIHVTAHANLEMGRRYADEALCSVYRKAQRGPGIVLRQATLLAGAPPILRLTFDLGGSGWVQVGKKAVDFTVEDGTGPVPVTELRADDGGFVDLTLGRVPGKGAVVHGHYGARPWPSLRDRDQRPVTAFSQVFLPSIT